MSSQDAYLEIPKIGGKIELASYQDTFHIGKKELQRSTSKSVSKSLFNSISSVRKDKDTGKIIKQQFIITKKGFQYYIEDLSSTNGTYLGSINLKQIPPQQLNDGDKIIVPVEENGVLVQMEIIFHKNTPQVKISSASPKPLQNYKDPTQNSTSSPQGSVASGGGVYYDPTNAPTAPRIDNPDLTHSQIIRNAIYVDPYDPNNTSNSFILIRKKMPIPDNAFRHDSGLNFDMVYKLEKSEFWHISIALILLFIMIYHTYINMGLIIGLLNNNMFGIPIDFNVIFVEPLPTAVIFCLSFIIHEEAHLQMGKHYGFQSRFCLTKVGIKTTLRSAIIGIPIALPGAAVSVGVDPDDHKDEMGGIKIAGPASNFIFGMILLIAGLLLSAELSVVKSILIQGASMNFILGTFNMMPFEFKGFALDGKYVISWKKPLYFALVALLLIGLVASMVFAFQSA